MKRVALTAAVALVALILAGLPASPAGAAVQVVGGGSTWSALAVLQWQADVASQGLSINYQPTGSSVGRKFYIEDQYDFAVSEIPFQAGTTYDRDGNPVYDEIARASARPYAYMPIVAGGTSFMYHLEVNGQLIRDLRLSGETIAKIFTGGITNWNDPAIRADDSRTFPSKAIKPVLRADGSGTSAQFSAFLDDMFPSIWGSFCDCGSTSYFPYFEGTQAAAGSDGVAAAVASSYNDGAITYVEYGYAKQRNFPVVSVRNAAGYYVQPTAGNVAVALTRARLREDRTQILTDVYRNPDSRAYPVSSYSYMIVPVAVAGRFTAEKGDVLSRFILYFLCTGQQKAEILGYSPLPENLVGFGFDVVNLIPGGQAPPPIKDCANPTIQGEFSPAQVPPPPESARQGAPRQDTVSGDGSVGDGADDGAVTAAELDAAAGDTSATDEGSTRRRTRRDDGTFLAAAPLSVTSDQDQLPVLLFLVTGLVVLLAVFGPPTLSAVLRRRQ